MNTGKQINAMVVVLFLTLIALGVYAIWDPFRADSKEEKQSDLTLERASRTFSLNCRVCHGDRGQGGSAGGRLGVARPLNSENLQGFDDSGTFSADELEKDFDFVFDTISCGRAGTNMPTWGQAQGGTLSEEQIRQLAYLITEGKWDLAQEHADEIDAETVGHVTLDMPDGLTADATEIVVSNASKLARGQYLRIPVDEETEERVRILPDRLLVQRAIDGTQAVEHEVGEEITIVGAPPLEEGDNPPTLAEAIDEEATAVPVRDLELFSAGDVIELGGERMAVLQTQTGLPTTNQVLVRDVGREPHKFVISGSEGITAGQQIRLDGELLELVEIAETEGVGITLGEDLAATATEMAVSDPAFFAEHYTVRVGDELIEVQGAVDTLQLLSFDVGRAETTIDVTGTERISEGMIIRLGSELLRVGGIVQPARATIERSVQDTPAVDHTAGTAVLKQVAVDESGEPTEDPETGQELLEGADADATTIALTATTGITVNQVYLLNDELVRVTETEPAVLRVERGVEDTEPEEHARRVQIFDANILEVERGVQGTAAAAHNEGDALAMTEIEVDRAVEGTKPEDHSKNAEVFLGNTLIVERGVKETDATEHEDAAEVLDFPLAPDSPATTGTTCGQEFVAGGETPSGPTPTAVAGATSINVVLTDDPAFAVEADPDSGPSGAFAFQISNEGNGFHNFRVIRTDLEQDALPISNDQVDEAQVEILAQSDPRINAGQTATVQAPQLDAGSYVLICNVPTHYEGGMHTSFEVQ